MRRAHLWLTLALALAWPAVAAAGPVAAAVAAAASAIGASAATAAAIGSFVAYTALPNIGLFLASRLLAPKPPKIAGQERQASVIQVQIGEVPREAVFGRARTAGSLIKAFNWGGKYGTDLEVIGYALMDHLSDGLEGFYVGENYYAYTGWGAQAAFSDSKGANLWVMFQPGYPDQTPPEEVRTNGGWANTVTCAGVAVVWVMYRANPDMFPGGRPQLSFVVRGKRCYDPRFDSTVPGGFGPQRWTDPSTWVWTDNPAVCHYNYMRGVYACDRVNEPGQLLIGRGLSATEAPPERVAYAANLCDELVALKAGGTEKRYRCGGVIRANEPFGAVAEMFEAAMGGLIVQRQGGVEIEPGHAKTPVLTFIDDDLIDGEPVSFSRITPRSDKVNSVAARYVEPGQAWADHAAPVRRSLVDIAGDGVLREDTLPLVLVQSGTQAQRCAEIRRRAARLPRRATVTLGPHFGRVEDGDWVAWQSDRFHAGATVWYRVAAWTRGAGRRVRLTLHEIAASVYSWTAASDEATPQAAPLDLPAAPGALALTTPSVFRRPLYGADGSYVTEVVGTWSTAVGQLDPAIRAVRLEVRSIYSPVGQVAASATIEAAAGAVTTTNGVPPLQEMQARLVPIGPEGRAVQPSPWTTLVSYVANVGALGGVPAATVLTALTPGANVFPNGGLTNGLIGCTYVNWGWGKGQFGSYVVTSTAGALIRFPVGDAAPGPFTAQMAFDTGGGGGWSNAELDGGLPTNGTKPYWGIRALNAASAVLTEYNQNIAYGAGQRRQTLTATLPADTARVDAFAFAPGINGGYVYAQRVKGEAGSLATPFTDDLAGVGAATNLGWGGVWVPEFPFAPVAGAESTSIHTPVAPQLLMDRMSIPLPSVTFTGLSPSTIYSFYFDTQFNIWQSVLANTANQSAFARETARYIPAGDVATAAVSGATDLVFPAPSPVPAYGGGGVRWNSTRNMTVED